MLYALLAEGWDRRELDTRLGRYGMTEEEARTAEWEDRWANEPEGDWDWGDEPRP